MQYALTISIVLMILQYADPKSVPWGAVWFPVVAVFGFVAGVVLEILFPGVGAAIVVAAALVACVGVAVAYLAGEVGEDDVL